jgi:hypothetical protein
LYICGEAYAVDVYCIILTVRYISTPVEPEIAKDTYPLEPDTVRVLLLLVANIVLNDILVVLFELYPKAPIYASDPYRKYNNPHDSSVAICTFAQSTVASVVAYFCILKVA